MAHTQPLEAMLELVRERGDAISRDDLRELDWLTTKLPLEDAFEQRGWVDEAITLIITDPSYAGDITPNDLA